MNYTALLTLTMVAVIAVPAAAQNPAGYTNNNGTLVYTPYNGYPAAPSTQSFGTYDPNADPFYNASAACNSPVMQQNGWNIVRQTSPNQCQWQKSKMSNPQYVEWLRRKQEEYAARQRAADVSRRQDVPVLRMSELPAYAPVPTPQQTLQQRLGTPPFMPVPNVPASAVPSWFPTWQQYQNATNPRGGLNEFGRRGR